ncbi:MAG: hypothetical protein K0S47_2798 [Herbinix sp.]|jgi:hypothetical protein|nr:hypothetical protein [Herbinix sp.]
MPDRENSQDPNQTLQNNNGVAERNITAEDMKEYKNALDSTRNYVSGDREWSSSSHQFSRSEAEKKKYLEENKSMKY